MFQGRPSSEEGEFFNIGKISTISQDKADERRRECVALVRAYDNAATDEAGAYSVGTLMGIRADGKVTVFDIWRERVDSAGRLKKQLEIARADGIEVVVKIPQDPGSAGKFEAWFTEQQLESFTVVVQSVSGSKEMRAMNYSSAVKSGDVEFIEADRNAAAKREMRDFPLSEYKDIVDSSSDAYNYLYEIFRKGTIIKNYRPQRNLVTYSSFANKFPFYINNQKVLKIPAKWRIYVGVKIQSDASKPTSAVIAARASHHSNLPEHVFVFAEYKSYDSDFYKLFNWIETTLKDYCEQSDSQNTSIFLHPDCAQFLPTIRQKLKYGGSVFEKDKFAGITEMNWYMLPYEQAHPFNELEQATRMMFLVPDEQFAVPINEYGLYSARQEIKTWGYNDKGEPSGVSAVLDCLRMLTFQFRTNSEPLTIQEEFLRLLPPEAIITPGSFISPEMQMSIMEQQEIAAQELARKYGFIEEEEFDKDTW